MMIHSVGQGRYNKEALLYVHTKCMYMEIYRVLKRAQHDTNVGSLQSAKGNTTLVQ